MKVLLFMLFVIQLSVVYGARILVIESCGSHSHWQFMKSIVDVLTERHHVTAITPILSGDQENYTEINATSVFPVYGERDTVDLIKSYSSVFDMVPLYPKSSFERNICDSFYAFEPVKRILKANDGNAKANRYDMIIMEPFYSSCLSYLAYRLQVPEIHVHPSSLSTTLELMVEPNPSYVVSTPFSSSFFSIHLQYIYAKFVPLLTEIRMKYKKPRRYDAVGLKHKPSGVLSNVLEIVDTPRPYVDNMERIGGIHLRPPNPLPDDVLRFIEDSPHGVIYISFGSISSMSNLPENIQQAFVGMFENVPQRILWKYSGKTINLPKNVMTKKWLPQRDILLHPNVRLFISHGGISGIYEAIDAGVPILGFPLFYDQPRNVGFLVKHGIALSMDLLSVNEESLLENVQELLYNEKYSSAMKNVSEEFKTHVIKSPAIINSMVEQLICENRLMRNSTIEFSETNHNIFYKIFHFVIDTLF